MNIYRGRPAHLPDDSDDRESLGLDEEPIVIVQLLNRVQDGTRCRTGSLDMCIQGKCQVNAYTSNINKFDFLLSFDMGDNEVSAFITLVNLYH